MSSGEEERDVFIFLQQQNCCLRCCFRFIGWKAWRECYHNPITLAKTLGYITEDASIIDKVPCVACLGILQDQTLDLVIQKIQTEVEKQNYDSDTFSCALTIPTCVSLRERILHAKWIDKFSLIKDELHQLKRKLETIKDIWKAVVTPKLEKAVNKKVDLITPSAFLIEIILSYKENDKECEALENLCVGANNTGKKRKRRNNDNRFSRKSVEALITNVTEEEFNKFVRSFSLNVSTSIDIGNIACSHSSIFIGGRYNKLSREISQTPWFINGEKKMETSVQDLLCNPIADAVKAQSIKFLSSGREDVDVRTIYSGRPFAVELINPRMTKITDALLSNLIQKINQSSKQVQITTNLKVLSRLDLKKLKKGEKVKTKIYRAICICRTKPEDMLSLEKLNNMKRIEIIQKTPIRVLHRRPLSPRIRVIYEMRARWMKPQESQALLTTASEDPSMFFVLDIKTQAGTYVKEFVHGDFGRTKPSLCDILKAEVDIVALDVTGINLDWP
ncbi:pseudouridine synthase 10 [Nomia melanderi]|uniref:pseudouridine synthase 10 n=1 Tax=Nomia melanderi TaxID=2448451 RepID=UPI001303F53E|nr:putative tRNA pseudouridine synthase Pus10 [Nomia melanderi]XP_031835607.1 putative tRNA pseudouridine synthase Pus10 [Nomia melanderi]XP_031835608.1 putative tRNA pseudouridine synthase Pus10 [Nomia melanderi]